MNKIEEERALTKLRRAYNNKDTLICFRKIKRPNMRVVEAATSRNIACLEEPNCDHLTFTRRDWLGMIMNNHEVILSKRMTPDMVVSLLQIAPVTLRALNLNFYRPNLIEEKVGHMFTHDSMKALVQLLVEGFNEDNTKMDENIRKVLAKNLYRICEIRKYEDCMVYLALSFGGHQKLKYTSY